MQTLPAPAGSTGATTRELSATRAHYRERVISAARLDVMDRATEQLERSGAVGRILAPGAAAPDFILPDTHGRPVRLRDHLDHGPVVVVFYRGGWCPYCNLHLRGFQRALPALAERGASLIAISPQLPDHSLATEEKNALEGVVTRLRPTGERSETGRRQETRMRASRNEWRCRATV